MKRQRNAACIFESLTLKTRGIRFVLTTAHLSCTAYSIVYSICLIYITNMDDDSDDDDGSSSSGGSDNGYDDDDRIDETIALCLFIT